MRSSLARAHKGDFHGRDSSRSGGPSCRRPLLLALGNELAGFLSRPKGDGLPFLQPGDQLGIAGGGLAEIRLAHAGLFEKLADFAEQIGFHADHPYILYRGRASVFYCG